MKRELYREMAALIQARINCKNSNNTEWYDKHTDKLQTMLDYLPHGSGLDYTWHYDFNKSNSEKIVLNMSFHSMDENGFYDGIIDFRVTITPSLMSGYHMLISGNFGRKHADIKQYLYDILTESFDHIIDC